MNTYEICHMFSHAVINDIESAKKHPRLESIPIIFESVPEYRERNAIAAHKSHSIVENPSLLKNSILVSKQNVH